MSEELMVAIGVIVGINILVTIPLLFETWLDEENKSKRRKHYKWVLLYSNIFAVAFAAYLFVTWE